MIHCLPEVVDVVEELQQGIHVACGSLILEPDEPSLFLAVIREIIRLVHHDMCLNLHEETTTLNNDLSLILSLTVTRVQVESVGELSVPEERDTRDGVA